MFSSYGLFSFGLAGPIAFLYLGFVAIGLVCSGAAIVVRRQASSALTTGNSQALIDSAIAILGFSVLVSILGGTIYVKGVNGIGAILTLVGVFILWPVSGLITVLERGAGRSQLLLGHGLIALLMVSLLLGAWIHGLL